MRSEARRVELAPELVLLPSPELWRRSQKQILWTLEFW